jgi:surface antigen
MKKFVVGAVVCLALAGCAGEKPKPPVVQAAPPASVVVALDDSDRMIIDQTLQAASQAQPGKPVSWTNPATGRHGALTVIRQGYTRKGLLCQEYHLVATEGPARGQQVGKACRGDGGRWQPEGGYTLSS